jgi:hypothetical protein
MIFTIFHSESLRNVTFETRQLDAEVDNFRGTYLVIKRDGVFMDLTY